MWWALPERGVMRLAALVAVLLLLLGVACSETKPRTLQLAPSPIAALPGLYPLRAEVPLPPTEPLLSVVLENARWEGATLVTRWRITNVGTRLLTGLAWQIGVSAIDPQGKYVDNLSNPSRFPLPPTATLHPGQDIAGERLLMFAAPAPNVVIEVSLHIGFTTRQTYTARFKAPRPPPG